MLFLYGNLIWFYGAPAAYLIDFTNQRRFYYGNSIFLNSTDTLSIIRPNISKRYYNYWTKRFPTNIGQLNLTVSLPWVNSFYLHPNQEELKVNTGFLGISAGLEYYYKDNKYLALTGSGVMDFLFPIPAAVHIEGEVEKMNSIYISLTDNYRFNRFTIGYGLNFSRNNWELLNYGGFYPSPTRRYPTTKSSNSIGFIMDAYHQIGKRFYVGLIYRPTLLNVYPDVDFKYEHLLSLDFKWKFRVKK